MKSTKKGKTFKEKYLVPVFISGIIQVNEKIKIKYFLKSIFITLLKKGSNEMPPLIHNNSKYKIQSTNIASVKYDCGLSPGPHETDCTKQP